MQNFSCNLEMEDTVTLPDNRDDNTYTVAKLKDGLCWMTQNLRIVDKTIYPTDSDIVSESYHIPASNSNGWDINDYDTSRAYLYSNNTEYGALYSWAAATAGTGTSLVDLAMLKVLSVQRVGVYLRIKN